MASLEVKTNLAHEKKKFFKCEKCKKKFISEARLKWHLVTLHEGNNPYQCIHCKKNFSFKKSLQKHIISAHDGGPYECSECSDTFDNKALCVLDTTIWKHKEGLIKATRVALNTLGFLKREIETYNDT